MNKDKFQELKDQILRDIKEKRLSSAQLSELIRDISRVGVETLRNRGNSNISTERL